MRLAISGSMMCTHCVQQSWLAVAFVDRVIVLRIRLEKTTSVLSCTATHQQKHGSAQMRAHKNCVARAVRSRDTCGHWRGART